MAASLWSVRRRPPPRFLAWTAIPATAVGAAAWLLIPRLMIEPSPWPGAAAGVVLAAAVLASVAQGSGARVEADGMLVYSLRGADMWRIPLAAVDGFAAVGAGMLAGVGLRCDPQAVEHLSRKGPTRAEHQRLHRDYGIGAVMEHLTAADLQALDALRQRFALAPTAPAARSRSP